MQRIANRQGLEAVVHQLVAVANRIHYLSMGGTREAVEAVWGSLASYEPLWIRGHAEPFERSYSSYRYRSARVGRVYHGLVLSHAVPDGELLVWSDEAALAKGVSRILNVPILEIWAPFLKATIPQIYPQKSVFTVGIQAFYLPRHHHKMLLQSLQEGLRKGSLPLPPSALESTGRVA